MCDLGPVSGMFASAGRTGDPNFIGPTRAASSTFVGPVRGSGSSGGMFDMFNSTTTGEMLKGIGGVASAFGTGADYDDLAAQRELRAGQILAATKQSIELKRLEQSRAMGSTKARIGKAGVAMSGSAAKLIERQEVLDEMAIEAAKNRGILQIGGEMANAATDRSKARTARIQGIQTGLELGGKAFKGFELG